MRSDDAANLIDSALRSLGREVDQTVRRMRALRPWTPTNPEGYDMSIAAKIAAWTGVGLGVLSLTGAGFLLSQNLGLGEQNLRLNAKLERVCQNKPELCADVTPVPELSFEDALERAKATLHLDTTENLVTHKGTETYIIPDWTQDDASLTDKRLAGAFKIMRLDQLGDQALAAHVLDAAIAHGPDGVRSLLWEAGLTWPPASAADTTLVNDPAVSRLAVSRLRTARARMLAETADVAGQARFAELEARVSPQLGLPAPAFPETAGLPAAPGPAEPGVASPSPAPPVTPNTRSARPN